MSKQLLSKRQPEALGDDKRVRHDAVQNYLKLLLLSLLITISTSIFSATISTTGSGNWSSNTPNAPWPSGIIPSTTDNIIIGEGTTLTVDGNRTCYSLSFDNSNNGIAKGTLTVNAGFLLTIVSDFSCPGAGMATKVNGSYKITGAGSISSGTFNCNNSVAPNGSGNTTILVTSTINALTIAGALNIYSTYVTGGNKFNNATFNIQSGTVTVKGSLTTNNSSIFNKSTLDLVTFASNPTLVLNGSTPFDLSALGTSTIDLDGAGATVNYGAAGTQTVSTYPYTNLALSGSGIKTLPFGLSIAGNLTVSGAASATSNAPLNVPGNVTIGAGTTFNAGALTHKIGGTFTNNGTFNAGTSTINLSGSSAQAITGTATTTFNNLTVSNAAGVSLAEPVKVTSFLSFGNVNNSVLSTGELLTLVSTATGSGSLKDITNAGANSGNKINGNVTIERYVQGKRSYRFLSVPVNSTTSIRANWMENTSNTSTSVNNNPVPNYGTHITGAGGNSNGFDATGTNNPSLFTFNNSSQAWTAVGNTNGLFSAGSAYRIMVRGSRNIDLNDNNAVPSATTLRATGTLVTGTVTMAKAGAGGTTGMPQLTSVSGAYSFIANPYASSVNWLALDRTDVSSTIYVYDPTISGSNGRGGYVAFNAILNANNILNSVINSHIQDGQAFFVETTGPNPSITFKESAKSTTVKQVFRTTNDVANLSVQLLLPTQVGATGVADGTKIYFSEDFNTAIGDEDSYKFTNLDENIAVLKNNKALSIEGRKPVYGTDTVQLKIWQLSQTNYTLKLSVENFAENVEGYLEDSYSHTTTPLNANGETLVPFAVTSDALSVANNRFRVVFETLATLPVRLTGIKAYVKNKGVQVDWIAKSESNMDIYEVERSADAQHFETIASAKAINNSGIATAYNAFDVKPNTADNYYRIKAIEKSGDVKYSEVVRVRTINGDAAIKIYPNPVVGNNINVVFTNGQKATYNVSLVNNAGQKVYTGSIVCNGGTETQTITIQRSLAKGIYQLQLSAGDKVENLAVSVQ